jgi:hypothetical protein
MEPASSLRVWNSARVVGTPQFFPLRVSTITVTYTQVILACVAIAKILPPGVDVLIHNRSKTTKHGARSTCVLLTRELFTRGESPDS